MDAKRTIISSTLAWLLLAIGSFVFGVAASGAAATLGITDFANDHRGEWGAIITPTLTLVALSAGFWPYRFLRRNLKNAAPVFVAATIAVLSCAWITWRFSRGV